MTISAPRVLGGRSRRIGLLGAVAVAAVIALPNLLSPSVSSLPPDQKDPNDGDPVVTWAGDGSPVGTGAAAPTQANLEFVSFGAACRFLDTRLSGGPLAAGQFRDVGVLDANLPAGLGPCGVPARAQAVQVSLSTISGSPTGSGYARMGPAGAEPTATLLQFGAGQGVSVTTSVSLNASKLRLKSYTAGAGYVGDLLGYWQAPIQGRISGTGSLISGSGVLSVSKSTAFAGDVTVTFDRPVEPGCSAAAIVESSGTRMFAYPTSSTAWFFDIRAYDSTSEADSAFSFVVQC